MDLKFTNVIFTFTEEYLLTSLQKAANTALVAHRLKLPFKF